ncbi:MAG: cytoplasmic protein [Deltaproteobacteria bacterium]|jgi:hypothetical protein|nr:cytoplasmic protein [Deltaproteobacteria bacterium]
MGKFALFAFNGEAMCFMHVLLNALDMHGKGQNVKVVIEGAATKLIPELSSDSSPLKSLFEEACIHDLVDGVCMACSNKMGTLEAAKAMGLKMLNEMSGHPSMGRYCREGFEIITF